MTFCRALGFVCLYVQFVCPSFLQTGPLGPRFRLFPWPCPRVTWSLHAFSWSLALYLETYLATAREQIRAMPKEIFFRVKGGGGMMILGDSDLVQIQFPNFLLSDIPYIVWQANLLAQRRLEKWDTCLLCVLPGARIRRVALNHECRINAHVAI